MDQLIPLQSQTINGNAVETVSARELHEFLESKQDFSTWIKNRVEQYDFVENADYLLHKFMEQTPSGAKHKIDYYITLDMTKVSWRDNISSSVSANCEKTRQNLHQKPMLRHFAP